jgi:hypothetical protein
MFPFPAQGGTGYGTTDHHGREYEVDRNQGLVGEGYQGRAFTSVAPATTVGGMGGAAVVMGQSPSTDYQGERIGMTSGNDSHYAERDVGRHGVVKEGAGPLGVAVDADRVSRVQEEGRIADRLSQEARVVRESTGHVDDGLRKMEQQEREVERQLAREQREAEMHDRMMTGPGVTGRVTGGGVTRTGHHGGIVGVNEKELRKEEKQVEKMVRKEEKAAEKEERKEDKAAKQVYKHGEKREEAEERAREAALDAERARERLEGARMGHSGTGVGTHGVHGTSGMPGTGGAAHTIVTPVDAGGVIYGIETASPSTGVEREGTKEKGGFLGMLGLGGKSEAEKEEQRAEKEMHKEEKRAEKEMHKAEKKEEKAERQAEKQVMSVGSRGWGTITSGDQLLNLCT